MVKLNKSYMIDKIIALVDYKYNFGSKWNAVPYRSGMDKNLLKKYFTQLGYDIDFVRFSDFNHSECESNSVVIYTSSEDQRYLYKDYIEDVVLSVQEYGLNIIPKYSYLRANNNKVFMELLRSSIFSSEINNLSSNVYGTLDDLDAKINYPIVLKEAAGAMSTGVFLARNKKEFISIANKISRTPSFKEELKDSLRPYKHKNYKKESLYRKKFITQEFIPSLKSDYKILIFGEKYYIFERPVRKNDFRASGSGNTNYIYGSKVELPKGILDYALNVFNQANVPQLSIDVAYDGTHFYLIEFQALFFGTVGHVKSDGFYKYVDNNWKFIYDVIALEQVYAESIDDFIKNKL